MARYGTSCFLTSTILESPIPACAAGFRIASGAEQERLLFGANELVDPFPARLQDAIANTYDRLIGIRMHARPVREIKMTRPSLSTEQLGEQLIIDIAKYKKHPACRTLFCVVYDPEGRITNPQGVENDLKDDSDQMATRIMIVPRQAPNFGNFYTGL